MNNLTNEEIAECYRDALRSLRNESSLVPNEQTYIDGQIHGIKRQAEALAYRIFKANDVDRWEWLKLAEVE